MTSIARRAQLATLPTLAAPASAPRASGRLRRAFPAATATGRRAFTPGGSPEALARMLADEGARRWPHSATVVANRPGARAPTFRPRPRA